MADDLLAVELDNIAAMIGLASELPMTADPRRVVDVYAPRLLNEDDGAVLPRREHPPRTAVAPAERAASVRLADRADVAQFPVLSAIERAFPYAWYCRSRHPGETEGRPHVTDATARKRHAPDFDPLTAPALTCEDDNSITLPTGASRMTTHS